MLSHGVERHHARITGSIFYQKIHKPFNGPTSTSSPHRYFFKPLSSSVNFNLLNCVLNRGSYMSAHVLLNLLNELGKRDKMRGLPSMG